MSLKIYVSFSIFVTASSVHVFKEVYQRTNFSQITYKCIRYGRGKDASGFELIGLELWQTYNGKNFKKNSSLKRRDPQLIDLCLGSFIHVCYFHLVFVMLLCANVYLCLGKG